MTNSPHPSPSPPAHNRDLSDAAMDAAMGRLLQIGVLLASVTVLTGGLLYLHANGARSANYRAFMSEPPELRQPLHLLHALAHGDPAAIIQIGVLLLIATPVARVVFAAVAFTMQRDRLYIGISILVLVILLAGLFSLA